MDKFTELWHQYWAAVTRHDLVNVREESEFFAGPDLPPRARAHVQRWGMGPYSSFEKSSITRGVVLGSGMLTLLLALSWLLGFGFDQAGREADPWIAEPQDMLLFLGAPAVFAISLAIRYRTVIVWYFTHRNLDLGEQIHAARVRVGRRHDAACRALAGEALLPEDKLALVGALLSRQLLTRKPALDIAEEASRVEDQLATIRSARKRLAAVTPADGAADGRLTTEADLDDELAAAGKAVDAMLAQAGVTWMPRCGWMRRLISG